MNSFTSLYNSTYCNKNYVDDMVETAEDCGYKEIISENCGYVLVDKNLIPITFIQRVQAQLDQMVFNYGFVLNESSIFTPRFLDSLDVHERKVLMHCVLILIERGNFGVNLHGDDDEEVVAEA